MTGHVTFPEGWIGGSQFEHALNYGGVSLDGNCAEPTRFTFSGGTKLMVDAGARLLSVVNQLVYLQTNVTLEFSHEDSGTFDYLDRAGFFEHLDPSVQVLPHKPVISTVNMYRGANRGLVEFAALQLGGKDCTLPGRLTTALVGAISDAGRRQQLGDIAFTLFAELVGNVYAHSDTVLPGFAVLQVYPKGNAARIAVSDSGKGLLETLKPALEFHHPHLVNASDTRLLIQALQDGLSRRGKHNGGCGLKVCADKAVKLGANLDVRLPNIRFHLETKRGAWQFGRVRVYDHCPTLWGTHIAFEFPLD